MLRFLVERQLARLVHKLLDCVRKKFIERVELLAHKALRLKEGADYGPAIFLGNLVRVRLLVLVDHISVVTLLKVVYST